MNLSRIAHDTSELETEDIYIDDSINAYSYTILDDDTLI